MRSILDCLKMRKRRSPFLVILIGLSVFLASSARTEISEIQNYRCSDGKVYSVWVDPEPLGGLTPEGIRLQFRAFCTSSARTIVECLKDESRGSQKCFAEFKRAGNLSEYLGSQVILAGKIRHGSEFLSRRTPASLVDARK